MKGYLLDTDICIELLKHNERVIEKIEAAGQTNCFVTEITIAELFYGAAKANRIQHFKDVELIQKLFNIIPLFPSLRLYGTNKTLLEKAGLKIGEFDLLIGSCAVFNQLVMVTSNIKHFNRIPNIEIEDWAKKSRTRN